jgi:hypothetical protein
MTGEMEGAARPTSLAVNHWANASTPRRLDAAHAMAVYNYAGKLPLHPSVPWAGCGGYSVALRLAAGAIQLRSHPPYSGTRSS